MRGKSTDGVNGRANRNLIAAYVEKLRAINQRPPRRADGLEADNNDMRIGFPKIVLEMVRDTTAVAHATTGDDQGIRSMAINAHRLVRRAA